MNSPLVSWLMPVRNGQKFMPDMDLRFVDYHQLLRTMDALIEYQEVIYQ